MQVNRDKSLADAAFYKVKTEIEANKVTLFYRLKNKEFHNFLG